MKKSPDKCIEPFQRRIKAELDYQLEIAEIARQEGDFPGDDITNRIVSMEFIVALAAQAIDTLKECQQEAARKGEEAP